MGVGVVQDSRLCMTVIKRNKRMWQTVILKEGQNTRARGAFDLLPPTSMLHGNRQNRSRFIGGSVIT